jgi:DNA-binding LacI/PurR family transcriptional regulator
MRFNESILGPHGIMALGVIGYASAPRLPKARLEELAAEGVRIVSIGRPVSSRLISQVLYDNTGGVRAAIDHLIALGARRVWLLGADGGTVDPHNVSMIRLAAAARVLRRRSNVAPPVFLAPDVKLAARAGARRAVESALARNPPPDAIFCAADALACGCLRALENAGLRAGSDVAVIGYNDDPTSEYLSPALTTVRIPVEALGREGANLLIDAIEGRRPAGTRMTMKTELVIRQSAPTRGRSLRTSHRTTAPT